MRKMLSLILALAVLPAFAQEESGNSPSPDQKVSVSHYWRIELSGGPSVYSGQSHRSGDWLTKLALEYEKPATERLTLGLRLLPALLYEQDGNGEDTVLGGGLGLAARLYAKPGDYRGVFGEASAHAIAHRGQIEGNSSNINFLTGLGLGYQFENQLSTVFRWEHISNANLGHHNRGVNVLTLGLGMRF